MDVEDLKDRINNVIDEWFDEYRPKKEENDILSVGDNREPVERNLPDNKRVVRTKTSGDRVYELDETKKTRCWITNEAVLNSRGWQQSDVVEVEEDELLKYQMGPAIYKVDES